MPLGAEPTGTVETRPVPGRHEIDVDGVAVRRTTPACAPGRRRRRRRRGAAPRASPRSATRVRRRRCRPPRRRPRPARRRSGWRRPRRRSSHPRRGRGCRRARVAQRAQRQVDDARAVVDGPADGRRLVARRDRAVRGDDLQVHELDPDAGRREAEPVAGARGDQARDERAVQAGADGAAGHEALAQAGRHEAGELGVVDVDAAVDHGHAHERRRGHEVAGDAEGIGGDAVRPRGATGGSRAAGRRARRAGR